MRAAPFLATLVLVATVPLVPPAAAATTTVFAHNLFWSPASIEIAPGDSVTFTNATSTPHTWARDDGMDSCTLPCTRVFASAGTIPFHCGIHPSMTGTIQVGAGVALAVTTPTPGATVGGDVAVAGTASHPGEAIASVTVRFGSGPSVSATLTGPPTSVSWSASIDSVGLAEGAQSLVVRATTTGGAFREVVVPVVVDNPDRLDLAVTFAAGPSSATTVATISFNVMNRGNVASGPVRVAADYLYQGEWHPAAATTIASVSPGATRSGSVAWSQPGTLVGTFTVRVTADPDLVLPDVERANNARNTSASWFTNRVDGIDLRDPL